MGKYNRNLLDCLQYWWPFYTEVILDFFFADENAILMVRQWEHYKSLQMSLSSHLCCNCVLTWLLFRLRQDSHCCFFLFFKAYLWVPFQFVFIWASNLFTPTGKIKDRSEPYSSIRNQSCFMNSSYFWITKCLYDLLSYLLSFSHFFWCFSIFNINQNQM